MMAASPQRGGHRRVGQLSGDYEQLRQQCLVLLDDRCLVLEALLQRVGLSIDGFFEKDIPGRAVE